MAGGRIKGITIELNGDSSKLEASLKSVSSEIRNTESKLKDVNKLLKMDPGNTNLLSQKYKTLQQEIQATKQKLDTLKEASKQADQALKDGTISREQYDALQREIAETEQKLNGLEQEYKNFGSVQAQQVAAAGEKMKELGGKMESAGKTLTTHVTLPLAAVGAAGVASFAEVDKTSVTDAILAGVEDVLVNGNRTLPLYVDEHDCISDIKSISTGSVKDRSAYKQGKTIVKNRHGSTWTFWCFPDSTSDPFGYTEAAYKAATGGKAETRKTEEKSSNFPYLVRITTSDLNYRKGPGTSYASYGYIEPGVYTIVDEQDGWGLLKAYAEKRNGWVKLSYTEKV